MSANGTSTSGKSEVNDTPTHGIAKLMHSKRFWSAVGTLVSLIVNELSGRNVPAEWIITLGGILIGGYTGQDVAREFNNPKSNGGE